MHVEGERGGRAALGDLAEGVHVGHRIGAHAPVLARDRERVQAGRVQVGVVLVGERGIGVVPRRARREAVARERGHALHHGALLVGEGREREHWPDLLLPGPGGPGVRVARRALWYCDAAMASSKRNLPVEAPARPDLLVTGLGGGRLRHRGLHDLAQVGGGLGGLLPVGQRLRRRAVEPVRHAAGSADRALGRRALRGHRRAGRARARPRRAGAGPSTWPPPASASRCTSPRSRCWSSTPPAPTASPRPGSCWPSSSCSGGAAPPCRAGARRSAPWWPAASPSRCWPRFGAAFIFAMPSSAGSGSEAALARHLRETRRGHVRGRLVPPLPGAEGALRRRGQRRCPTWSAIPTGSTARPDLCEKAGVKAFPTWVIGSQRREGVQSLGALADASKFQPPPPPAASR